jgi:hypothetical protein
LLDIELAGWAAFGGRLELLKYLLESAYLWVNNTAYAALGGSLECLKYLCEDRGEEITIETCLNAARCGSIECLKYVHRKGGGSVCYQIAAGGHLESCSMHMRMDVLSFPQ